jgi:hypothetical protein
MAGEMLTMLFHNEDEGLQEPIFSQYYQGNGLELNQPFRKSSWEVSDDDDNIEEEENSETGQKVHYYYTNIKEDEKIVYETPSQFKVGPDVMQQ